MEQELWDFITTVIRVYQESQDDLWTEAKLRVALDAEASNFLDKLNQSDYFL